MYKRASLMCGGTDLLLKIYSPRKGKHGMIHVTKLNGKDVDLMLPGDFSPTVECDRCYEYFLLQDPIYTIFTDTPEFPHRRRYGLFCGEHCARAWLKSHQLDYDQPIKDVRL
jgi:hypothetical protein